MANRSQIIVTLDDHRRLENLLASEFATVFSDKPYLQSLRNELSISKIVGSDEVPPDVVTMNSTVRLKELLTNEIETYTLVYPEDADIAAGKLSVLAPIGTAILGYRVGDDVEWQVPIGMIRFTIAELVFQPESDGVVA